MIKPIKTRSGFFMCCTFMLVLATGCSINRSVIDVQVQQIPNPAHGGLVKIVRVTDRRIFKKSPKSTSTHSVKGDHIEDKALTSRVMARKLNGFGMAIGDILLPEGQTVELLVREALTKAFREAGYQVVAPDDMRTDVVPVEADIEQFWAWMEKETWSNGVVFETKVSVMCAIPPFKSGETVTGKIVLHSQAVNAHAWVNVINKGIRVFSTEVKNHLLQPAK